jgi:branched-chain amino acid transport system permease protein
VSSADLPPRDPQLPPEEAGGPRIGRDEWVARAEERRGRRTGPLAPLLDRWDLVPPWARFLAVVVLAGVFPLLTENEYYQRVGVNVLLFALLALGLNIVVGWAGLLDLGYVAFYGFGAYAYAVVSSGQFDWHLPTPLALVVVLVSSALLGLILGLPSRRLLGDYLAIVTLFFAQIFVVVTNNANRVTPPWRDQPLDLTGGPNGIADLDQFGLFGREAVTPKAYFYIALATFTVVLTGLHLLNQSRTGRAWRAVREDPLAAEAMGMPVQSLKLLAFAFGAATAGLTGSIFAALQTGVFPQNFELPLLITIYAIVILGGAGSITGVVIGAVLLTVLLEVIQTPEDSRFVFYGVILLTLVAWLRPWRWLAVVVAGTVLLGLAVHEIAERWWKAGTGGEISDETALARLVDHWIIRPENQRLIGNIAFVAAVVSVLAMSLLRGRWRLAALPPALYLAAVAWENRLSLEPGITPLLLLGALLVALMTVRPQGLLGTSRVEIV